MRITIHQPAFLPWLGLMSKIKESDIFVCLDNVQFSKNSFDNRNRIMVGEESRWLTIPVKTKGRFKNNPMNKVEIADMDFSNRHWTLLNNIYQNTANVAVFTSLGLMYESKSTSLLHWQLASMDMLKKYLGVGTSTYYLSSLGLTGKSSDLILNICKHFKATEYLSGPRGADYLDLPKFKKNNIKVKFHHWDTNWWLSSIHYLLRIGTERTVDVLRNSFKLVLVK